MDDPENDPKLTTIRIFAADRDYLKRQLPEVSYKIGRMALMADALHDIIKDHSAGCP